MTRYRIKYKTYISELYIPQETNGAVILLLDGLPKGSCNKPFIKSFVGENFTVFAPDYTGSFDSAGVFDWRQNISDVQEFVGMAKKKNHEELFFGKEITISCNKVIVMGISYGASVAALAAPHINIDLLILLSPVLIYNQNTIAKILPEFNFEHQMHSLLNLLVKGYPHTYRGISKNITEWKQFLIDGAKEPYLYLDDIKMPVMTMHGDKDSTYPNAITRWIINNTPKTITALYPENLGHSLSEYSNAHALTLIKTIKRYAKL